MPKIAMLNQEGAKVGEIELSEAIFASEINESVLHLVVRSQLAAKRQGTQSAKTRGEVRGGGRKIYRQKGTGNARHHGNRAPQFTHGGVVFAPKPRDYVVNVPKKVRRLALKGALTSKVNDGEMIVLDKIALTAPKTREVAKILKNLGVEKTALLVLADQLIKLWASNVLQPVGAMPLIPHVVELRFVLNQGMAFSLLSGKQLFLIAATSAALLLVAYALFFRSRGKYLQQAALILVLGGGIGNLIDRVLNGEVVDYINLLFMRFAVFNFADICVCVGVALWVLVIFLEESHSGNADAPKEP